MSVRRVKGHFNNLSQTKQSIIDSKLSEELLGSAYDLESGTVYISNSHQRPLSYWQKLIGKYVSDLELWDSKESIKTFAERNSFLLVEGSKREITADGIKERMIQGTNLDNLESEFFLNNDVPMLELVISKRAELLDFEENMVRIRTNAARYALGKFHSNYLKILDPYRTPPLIQKMRKGYNYTVKF